MNKTTKTAINVKLVKDLMDENINYHAIGSYKVADIDKEYNTFFSAIIITTHHVVYEFDFNASGDIYYKCLTSKDEKGTLWGYSSKLELLFENDMLSR